MLAFHPLLDSLAGVSSLAEGQQLPFHSLLGSLAVKTHSLQAHYEPH